MIDTHIDAFPRHLFLTLPSDTGLPSHIAGDHLLRRDTDSCVWDVVDEEPKYLPDDACLGLVYDDAQYTLTICPGGGSKPVEYTASGADYRGDRLTMFLSSHVYGDGYPSIIRLDKTRQCECGGWEIRCE